jgi:hypothetical protein
MTGSEGSSRTAGRAEYGARVPPARSPRPAVKVRRLLLRQQGSDAGFAYGNYIPMDNFVNRQIAVDRILPRWSVKSKLIIIKQITLDYICFAALIFCLMMADRNIRSKKPS